MKKLLSILVVLSIVLSTCIMGGVTVANAAEEAPGADFMFFDGVIEEYVGAGGVVVIPQAIDGVKVEEIAANAFFANKDITEVYIPEGIHTIGHSAFRDCENLEKVTLPYSLTALEASTFASTGLTGVEIPGNVEYVGAWCFSGCPLQKLVISYGVRRILVQAFCGIPGIDVVFPETVELIMGSAFGPQGDQQRPTYTICNPDCEIGPHPKNGASADDAKNGVFSGELTTPFTNPYVAMNYKVIVPKDSSVEEFFKNYDYKTLDNEGYHDNSITLYPKDEEYFDKLKENQEDWGIVEPRAEEWDPNNSNPGTNVDPENPNSGSEDQTGGNGQTGGNSQNGANGQTGGNTTLISTNNNSIWIVLIIVGAVVLLIIVGVVVFLVVFLKKPKKPALSEEEMMEKLMAKMAAKEEAAEEPTEEPTEE